MLTQAEIDSYNENGYLAVESVLTDEELESLRQVTEDYVEQSRQVTESDNIFDLEPGHTPESPKLRRIKQPASQHPVYGETMRHAGVLDILAQLIGPNIRAIGNKLNMKSGAYGSPVEWHQDWAFFPHTNNDVLAIGICLDDMTEANGCLMVRPGSHKGRILDHHQDGYFVGAVTEPDFDDSAAARIEVPCRRHVHPPRPRPPRLPPQPLISIAPALAVHLRGLRRLAHQGNHLGSLRKNARPWRTHQPTPCRAGPRPPPHAVPPAIRLDLRNPDPAPSLDLQADHKLTPILVPIGLAPTICNLH